MKYLTENSLLKDAFLETPSIRGASLGRQTWNFGL